MGYSDLKGKLQELLQEQRVNLQEFARHAGLDTVSLMASLTRSKG